VASQEVCKGMDMSIGDEHFITNLYVLPLDGFDIVLGIQWLHSLGPIVWDFGALMMSFWREGRMVQWTGVGGTPYRCSTISVPRTLLDALFESFADIFNEPHGLPPAHRHHHCIRLLLGTTLVAVQPYRYSQLLKNEIEQQCDEMLCQGIIRECTSAFSSLVLLVKK
jgi:hypothetical protein